MGSNYTVYTVYSTALKPKAILKEIAERVGHQILLKNLNQDLHQISAKLLKI